MALTLDATLAAAQNSLSRHPLVEIVSANAVPDIPFDGQYLHPAEVPNEVGVNVITHSSGRLCQAYIWGPNNVWPWQTEIRFVYTDVGRTTFSAPVTIPIAEGIPGEVTLCELADGNIGIIWLQTSNYWDLRYIVITPTGTVVSSDTIIERISKATYTIKNPWVTRLADDSFLLVYVRETEASGTYDIMKRTASVFTSWSAGSALSISGLDATHEIYNPSLMQEIGTDDIYLSFDYVDQYGPALEEMTNIYQSVSADNGATWGAATKVTNYTTYGIVGKHPIAVQKAADQMHLIFNKIMGALHMDTGTLGWCASESLPVNLTWDAANRKLYAVCVHVYAGSRCLLGVLKIDVDTWTIDDCWKCDTDPAFHQAFCEGMVWFARDDGEVPYITVSLKGAIGSEGTAAIAVLNTETEQITQYNFSTNTTHGWTENCATGKTGYGLFHTAVVGDRLYALFLDGYIWHPQLFFGYIDLTEAGPPYTWNMVVDAVHPSGYSQYEVAGMQDFLVLPSAGYIMLCGSWTAEVGHLRVYDYGSGGLIKYYHHDAFEAFPKYGLMKIAYSNGKVFGTFIYCDEAGEEDKRGLCVIDLVSNSITYKRPPWAALDDYGLDEMTVTADGRIIIVSIGHGITIFNPATEEWTLYDNDRVPGLTPDGSDAGWFGNIKYDEAEGMIFACVSRQGASAWLGLVMFNEFGAMLQSNYMIGTKTTGWSWSAELPIVQGYLDYDLAPALDPGDQSIYGFWIRKDGAEYSIKWDKENAEMKISDYLVKGTEVICKRSIDGPSTLAFSVSHGDLFDPTNANSLWSIYLEKFRKLNLRWGDKIDGVDYWQQAGVFYVVSNTIGYERPKYPTMEVESEDRRAMWEFANVDVSDNYDGNTPKDILEDLLAEQADLAPAELAIPVFEGSTDLWIQWLDTDLLAIVKQVCERFGYYFQIDIDGRATARKISNANPVDHVYPDLTKVLNYSPDDRFSDWTNQVMIECEARDFIEVLFGEERIKDITGSVGWYGGHKLVQVYYSEDKSRRVRNIRLEVIQSVADFQCLLKLFSTGGEEYIYDEDNEYKYCIIMIDRPDRTADLIAGIAVLVASIIACGIFSSSLGSYGGTCWSVVALELSYVLEILSGHALYNYAIWGCPVGEERQTYHAIANDLVLQAKINKVVQVKDKDPLCYSAYDCQQVADHRLLVIMLQRRRALFTKTAHLQDEDGDTIVIPHPVTGHDITLFITTLIRRYLNPASPGDAAGHFLDDIEGWRITA